MLLCMQTPRQGMIAPGADQTNGLNPQQLPVCLHVQHDISKIRGAALQTHVRLVQRMWV